MSLTKLPAFGGDLGPEKVDEPGVTPGLADHLYGSEWNAAVEFLVAIGEAIGLGDGSTAGSLEARVLQILNTLTRINGVYEARVETATDGGTEAFSRISAADDASTASVLAGVSGGNPQSILGATSGDLGASVLAGVSGGISALELGVHNATPSERATITLQTAATIIFRALNSTIPLNESGHEALPSGITSIVQGLKLLAALGGEAIEINSWSPTVTAVSNVSDASLASSLGRYLRFGGYVLCFARVSITPTSSGTVFVRIGLPVASDLASSNHVFGIASGNDLTQGRCYANTTNDEINIAGTRTATSSQTVDAFFIYTVQ